MKSFLQFIEDAPVRTYNDPSVISSPNERARAGGREKIRGRQNRLDQQAERDSIKKEPATSEKEAIFGAGQIMSSGFDSAGAAGKKEDDRKPLELRPKRIPAHEAMKSKFLEKLSEKEGFIPGGMRDAIDTMTKDREEDNKIKTDRFKAANKVMDSISGKHPFMDLLSGSMSTIDKPSGYQKRLQSIKEMIDNDDDGDSDEDLHPLIKQRLGLKGKSSSFIERLENEGLDPNEFMDTSESDELTSDLNIEDFDSDGSDFIPKYGRQISKSLKGISNSVAGDFLDSLDQSQKSYKNGDVDFNKLRNLFNAEDEISEIDDRNYEGLNTSWNLSPESFDDNGVTALDGVDRDQSLEVAWNNIVNPERLKMLRGRLSKGETNVNDILKEMMTSGNQRSQQRAMAHLNDYADKNGGSIQDILGTEDGIKGFEDHLKLMTVLDAKRTWKEQIFPDLEDGDVLRNSPLLGGRDGNARERIYKQVGFGELLSDDYQYGQKVEGENKLKPLDDTNLETFNEDDAKVETYETMRAMMPDLEDSPFNQDEFLNYMQGEIDYLDREDLQSASRDPEEFFSRMQETMIENQLENMDFATELSDVLDDGDENPISDLYQELDDEGIELSEFDEYVGDTIANLQYDNKVSILKLINSRNYDTIKRVMENIIAKYKEENQ